MSEEVKRTINDVQRDYSQKCMEAGDLYYKTFCFNAELQQKVEDIKALNAEAKAIQASAPPAEAPAAQPAVVAVPDLKEADPVAEAPAEVAPV